jgi:DNA-binding NarL/FixJ family response regulator
MAAPTPEPGPQVLILKADRLYAEALARRTAVALPAARLILAPTVADARAAIATGEVELFISGLGDAQEGDVLELIAQCSRQPAGGPRILVVAFRWEYRLLAALRTLPVDGVFDAMGEAPEAFGEAVAATVSGLRYWSPGVIQRLQQLAAKPTALFRLLTDFEQLALSVIGGGCDDDEAADLLQLSPATISSVRRDLHRKLGVQHRGALVRIAAQTGFVRFTPEGVERPGFSLLAAAYHPRHGKRRPQDIPQGAPA